MKFVTLFFLLCSGFMLQAQEIDEDINIGKYVKDYIIDHFYPIPIVIILEKSPAFRLILLRKVEDFHIF